MGTEYVMETRTAGWGDKWCVLSLAPASHADTIRIYLVTEFIIYPKSKPTKKLNAAKAKIDAQLASAPTSASGPIIPSISAPGTGTSTPQSVSGTVSSIPNMDEAKKAAARNRPPRADGGIVTCIAVFEYCFKIGRVTIPPVSSIGLDWPDLI